MLYTVYFFFFFVIAIYVTLNYKRAVGLGLTFVVCAAFAIWAGFRDFTWADTIGYSMVFEYETPTIFSFFSTPQTPLYAESGFFFLSSVIRTIADDHVVYFFIIAALSLYFLGDGISKYGRLPLLALCVYIARFMFGRHFMQIRGGLAIAILFWGIQYFTQKDWRKSAVIILIAYMLHRSALLAVPMFFMNYLPLKKWHVVVGIVLSMLVVVTMPGIIEANVQEATEDVNVEHYADTSGNDFKQEKGLGLRNPMIYYQIAILFAFTFAEERLKKLTAHYYTLRNGYLFSTVLLIVLSGYRILSARTSTVFATYEILMVPLLIYICNTKNRYWGYLGILLIYTAIFYMNMKLV